MSQALLELFDQGVVKTGTDLSSNMFYVVTEKSDGIQLCTSSDMPMGSLYNTPTSGQEALICTGVTAKFVTNGVITKGDTVTVDSSTGKIITLDVSGAVAGLWILGKAKESNTASGDIIEVRINIQKYYHS